MPINVIKNHNRDRVISSPGMTSASVSALITSAVTGLLDDRGDYDASVNLFPATGGSGTAGAILKGDIWRISVAGTLGTITVTVGDWVRALADTPGQTASNWSIAEGVLSAAGSNTELQYNNSGQLGASANLTFGSNALTVHTIKIHQPNAGNNNIGIGANTFNLTTTGTDSIGIGMNVMKDITSGIENIGIGVNSMFVLTTGSNNVAMGHNTMLSLLGATECTAVGDDAMYSNVSGNQSSAFGAQALKNATGGLNSGFGYYSGVNISTGTGNTMIGATSGQSVTTGSNNVFIGYNTTGVAGLTNGIGIGYNVTVSSNNTMVLGNGVNVGISTDSPTARLMLPAGTTTASTAPLKFVSGSLLTAAEAGAVEFLTDKWYGTITTGAARKEFALNDAALTSGTVPVATTNGRLTNSSITSSSGNITISNNGIPLTLNSANSASSLITLSQASTVRGYIDCSSTNSFYIERTGGGTTLLVNNSSGMVTCNAGLTSTTVKVSSVAGFTSSDGSTGATGSFVAGATTVTVKDGIITSIV